MADAGEGSKKTRFTRRALFLGLGQAAVFGGLGVRLYELQVRDAARLAPLAEQNRTDVQVVPAVRGRILDRLGRVLADNEQVYRVTITPALARDVRNVLTRLARVFPLSSERREQIAVRARRQSRTIPIVIAADLSFDDVAEISVLAPHLPGVRAEIAWRRRYHDGITMGHLIGYVGNADRMAREDSDPSLKLPGARVGHSGVELAMETTLRGEAGTIRTEVDARGRIGRRLDYTDAVPGRDLRLTVDSELQRRVLARLTQERRGAVVALEAQTGHVVAMASHPTFDPSPLAGNVSDILWRRLSDMQSRPMLNRAIAGLYPPGSTFKMVTALAALHNDVVSPKDHLTCDGSYDLGGRSFRCWRRHGHGSVDLHRALRESCDVYFYEMAHRVGIDAIADMARHLGLGRVFDTDIALQKPGIIPDPEWKRANASARHGGNWLGGETVLAGIGQGYVAATPLQLAVMAARIATGRAVEPYMVLPGDDRPREPAPPLRLQPRWLDAVRRGMVAVVNEEGGTGGNAWLDGIVVAGKTGTSQISHRAKDRVQADVAWEHRDHALFVAYAPAERPRYALAAVVEHGGGGGAVAAPLVRDTLQILLDHETRTSAADVRPPPRQEG